MNDNSAKRGIAIHLLDFFLLSQVIDLAAEMKKRGYHYQAYF